MGDYRVVLGSRFPVLQIQHLDVATAEPCMGLQALGRSLLISPAQHMSCRGLEEAHKVSWAITSNNCARPGLSSSASVSQ